MSPTRQLRPSRKAGESFAGFEQLTANFLYCPNQFFDVCLPNYSRGVVRLVAYILRRTLGWLDENGEPIEQDIEVPYSELISRAGISRGAIAEAIEQAVAGRFIDCVQAGQKNDSGCHGQAAKYRLRWDTHGDYTKAAEHFAGFYAGEGYRTPIPNSFFDYVVVSESLAVIKVVGTVLRHTIGYQNQFGRKQQAPLSYSFIQDYARIAGRRNVHLALHRALDVGYIRRVAEGNFHARSDQRNPATYAVRWLDKALPAAKRSKKKLGLEEQSKKETSNGPERVPAEQSKKVTNRKTELKDTDKQQDAAADLSKAMKVLRDVGFDEATTKELSQRQPIQEIEQQIAWLPLRNVSKNRLGLLRRAIEEAWVKPDQTRQTPAALPTRSAPERDGDDNVKAERLKRRHESLLSWQTLSDKQRRQLLQEAINQAASDLVRSHLRRYRNFAEPPPHELLRLVDDDLPTPVGESA